MAKSANKFESLNKVLPFNVAKKGSTRRHVSDKNKNDAVAEALAKCDSTADVATLGVKFGLSDAEVTTRAKASKNFGLYRMVIGNRIRGIVAKVGKAKMGGKKLTLTDAAYPPKKVAKKVAKKVVKKVTKKVTKKA